ncbi:MAG: ribosome recycling factor [Alphaproteobacteria bacterium]|jgi:ribosome recycling factor|nr:ribosome recycling factor [Alphaproteobacteria bacterium]
MAETEFDINSLKSTSNTKLEKTLESLDKDLDSLRTGRATPAMLDNIKVDNYGQNVPIANIGTVSIPDPRTILITVWDKALVMQVESAIHTSNLGVNPVVDGVKIKLPIPPLTEERRKEMTKKASEFAEKAKIAIRQIRKNYLEDLKTAQKNKLMSEDELKRETEGFDKSVKTFNDKIDAGVAKKSKEIMTI